MAIFNAKARSKMNYGATIALNHSDKIKELNIIQNKFIAVSTHRKKGTPTFILQSITKQDDINTVVEFELLKQYARIMHAPTGHPLIKLRNKYNNIINNTNWSKNTKRWKNTAIHRIMQLGRKTPELSINKANTHITPQHYKSPELFLIVPHPHIVFILTNQHPILNVPNTIVVFTDGSAFGNPGRGGFAWWISIKYQYKETCKTPTSITIMEIKAIKHLCNWVLENKDIIQKNDIYIYTDSRNAIRWLKCLEIPKYFYAYDLIQQTIKLMNKIIINNKLNIIKIKSKETGNKFADRLAKEAAKQAKLSPDFQHQTTYQTTMNQIKLHFRNEKKTTWKKIAKNNKHKLIYCFCPKGLPTKFFKAYNKLTKKEIIIITRLLTGHHGLNYYKHRKWSKNKSKVINPLITRTQDINSNLLSKEAYLKCLHSQISTNHQTNPHQGSNHRNKGYFIHDEINNTIKWKENPDKEYTPNLQTGHEISPICKCNKGYETLTHFILNCDLYIPQRQSLYGKLSSIHWSFKYWCRWDIQGILYPFTYSDFNWNHVLKIWKALYIYAYQTNRFRQSESDKS